MPPPETQAPSPPSRPGGLAAAWGRAIAVLAALVALASAVFVAFGGWRTSGWAHMPPGVPPRELPWAELIPPGWDPMKRFREAREGLVGEGSAAELAWMREMRATWDNAPVRSELDGARLRLSGYVVPLDGGGAAPVSSFLLVPYFGACIHSPPPPANQIVLVSLPQPAPWRTMEAVQVTGRLAVQRAASAMGASGYRLSAEQVQRLPPGWAPAPASGP